MISTLIRIANQPAATGVVVLDAAGARVVGVTPLVRHGNLAYAFVDLPDDRGPLLAVFVSDADGFNAVTEAPVEDPRGSSSGIVVGAWLIREGLRLVAAEDPNASRL